MGTCLPGQYECGFSSSVKKRNQVLRDDKVSVVTAVIDNQLTVTVRGLEVIGR